MQPIPPTFVQNIADRLQYVCGAIEDPDHFLFVCHQFKIVYYLVSDIVYWFGKRKALLIN